MVLKKKNMKEACECQEVLKEIKLNHVVLIKLRSMIKKNACRSTRRESSYCLWYVESKHSDVVCINIVCLIFTVSYFFVSAYKMKSLFLLLLLIDLTTKCTATDLIRLPIIKHATAHIAKRDNIPAIPLFNANAREYLIEIGLGTPPQMFNVTLDTGR